VPRCKRRDRAWRGAPGDLQGSGGGSTRRPPASPSSRTVARWSGPHAGANRSEAPPHVRGYRQCTRRRGKALPPVFRVTVLVELVACEPPSDPTDTSGRRSSPAAAWWRRLPLTPLSTSERRRQLDHGLIRCGELGSECHPLPGSGILAVSVIEIQVRGQRPSAWLTRGGTTEVRPPTERAVDTAGELQ
jgi:hypothetical protein